MGFKMVREVDNWDKLGEEVHRKGREVVIKAAHDVEAQAKVNAPKKYGFLAASIYTDTSTSSGYGQASTEAHAANPNGEMLPPTQQPKSDTEAVVSVGAEYGPHVEGGTVHGPAQPYMEPAMNAVAPSFDAAVNAILP